MSRLISRGKCVFCGQSFTRNVIARHLVACQQRSVAQQETPAGRDPLQSVQMMQLLVSGGRNYWLYIELPADTTLKRLDQFLRNIWLECCGHLSAFRLGGKQNRWIFEVNELSMSRKIKTVFRPDVLIQHEYDFGSTTTLELKYVTERKTEVRGFEIILLARNEPPSYKCAECDQPAARICSNCDNGWLCDDHAKSHACGEEMQLPVVNSPRVGVCGYSGSMDYDD